MEMIQGNTEEHKEIKAAPEITSEMPTMFWGREERVSGRERERRRFIGYKEILMYFIKQIKAAPELTSKVDERVMLH